MLFALVDSLIQLQVKCSQIPANWASIADEYIESQENPDNAFFDLRTLLKKPKAFAFPFIKDMRGKDEGAEPLAVWCQMGDDDSIFGPVRLLSSPEARMHTMNLELQHVGDSTGYYLLQITMLRHDWFTQVKMRWLMNAHLRSMHPDVDKWIAAYQDWARRGTLEYYSKGVSGLTMDATHSDLPLMMNYRVPMIDEVGSRDYSAIDGPDNCLYDTNSYYYGDDGPNALVMAYAIKPMLSIDEDVADAQYLDIETLYLDVTHLRTLGKPEIVIKQAMRAANESVVATMRILWKEQFRNVQEQVIHRRKLS